MTDNNRPVRQRPQAGTAPRYGAPGGGRSGYGRPNPPGRPAPGAPRPRQVPIGPSSGLLPRGFVPLALVCVGILALGIALQGLLPNGFMLSGIADRAERPVAAQVSEIHSEGPIRLNEIMSSNGGVLVDESGQTPDWVEVANVGSRPVDLQGYVLAKSAQAGNVLMFPSKVLQPGECVIVYADSTLKEAEQGELHAPFRLSSGGDVLMLFNDADVAVDTVNIPALTENTVYARTDRSRWTVSEEPTPGLLNTSENYRTLTTVMQNAPVRLAQIVASNGSLLRDESGACHDYVVLENTSGEPVDISGWYLSDKPQLPRLWRFPEGTVIPGGGSLTVFCSALDRQEDVNHLHTSFRLSTEGETVILSNASGQPVDSATYDLLKTDQAYVRGADGNWSVGVPAGASEAAP